MRYGICDDSEDFLKLAHDSCKSFNEKNGITYEIKLFASGDALLKYGTDKLDIIIMDVCMPKKSGLETAEEIRKTNPDVEIIMISTYEDYAKEGYRVEAFRYLLKNDFKELFDAYLSGVIQKIQRKKRHHYFKLVNAEVSLPLDDILYLRSYGHNTLIHLVGHEQDKYEDRPRMRKRSLDKLEEELSDYGFIRVHQSYLLNAKYIKSIRYNEFILQNGHRDTIARPLYKDVKKKFILLKGGF